jgi:hypothetical protein
MGLPLAGGQAPIEGAERGRAAAECDGDHAEGGGSAVG